MTHNRLPTWHQKVKENRTLGQRIADAIASGMGSWPFIIIQTAIILLWVTANIIGYLQQWDPYPFILLNLLFSTQAAYAAPIIMMTQKRAAERDHQQALDDYQTNIDAKAEIERLQEDLSRIEVEKLDEIIALLKQR
ncbi:DUF1003 domain-containing protein [Patescibacteria group bacterium]|nr:DUF1003 domain-containing protein [Patescibacteria group bacterium]MBU1500465.1 DUF1003 domain-containing protein [Patescibacteria group bacterium]MBU2080737.1 DUF1003 domain-containing protein [Patescibacteria group bacterium]MBU2123842.1 DUF1003 domain-containing protein [Patescibacteria group bacterium]MBU2194867.1 DUF1003 domain-containing protein [Patescibacteria group bacterium]